MKTKAFKLIEQKLTETLKTQNFEYIGGAEGSDNASEFRSNDTAVSLLYDTASKKFELRKAGIENGEISTEWKTLSVWLFDEDTDDISQADSIANDFCDTLSSSRRVSAALQPKKKKKKDEDSTTDPIFFFNRLVNIFPDLKYEMNKEKIAYGEIRPFTFAKEVVSPMVCSLVRDYPQSDTCKKMCEILSDMYTVGDLDTRAIISYVIIDSIPDDSFKKISDHFKDDINKIIPHTRRLIGKNIKPEKPKKQNKIIAESLRAYNESKKQN